MSNKLLVVEDDPGLQKQLKWALKANYELLFAADRVEAYHLFVKYKPPVVLPFPSWTLKKNEHN